ncbi:hypothetical protein [Nonomuraea diastatica]|uniref:Uncharacterized protein n=1 Tax=Nonomuraea diastatica TaxID=1848329 RepID=A0A4R4X0B6_9ACTN|nr:hypothetical protein [Nonomuraea diastatica]TDD23560.1 hypothetical protein E1294_08665 [Nonomuraea diastatica]
MTDWASASPRFGEKATLTADTRYHVNGTPDGRKVTVWQVSVPVDPAREAVSFTTSPTPNLKIFTLSARA